MSKEERHQDNKESGYLSLHYHPRDSVVNYKLPASSEDAASKFDFVMAFKIDNGQTDECKFIIHQLQAVGLFETFIYTSVQRDELIVLLKANIEKLGKFADLINFDLELDPDVLKKKLEEGVKYTEGPNVGKWKIEPREINENITSVWPYDHIYGRYECTPELQHFYLKSPTTDSLFSINNKLKLIYYMLIAPKGKGGCQLHIPKMIYKEQMLCCFPLHDRRITDQLLENIFKFDQPLWHTPFYDIKEYFGEKIALFNVFIGHYTQWLILPSIVGLAFQIVVWATNVKTFSSPVLPFYSVLITVWGIVMLEFWKRRQSTVALWWGTSDFETKDEQERPEYQGQLIRSPIDGSLIIYFPDSEVAFKVLSSTIVVATFVAIMCGSLAGIYVLRFYINDRIGTSEASYVASALTTALILTMNTIYQTVAKKLTDRENHRTDTQYEDALSAKIFVFQFLNSYASFFFIAFVAPYLSPSQNNPKNFPGQCGAETCMQPLAINLGIVFGMRLTFSNVMDILVPYVQYHLNKRTETAGVSKDNVLSRPEEEMLLMPYDPIVENINDYADTAVQYGFSMMFITALPCATFFSFVSNFFRIKFTLWKRIKLYRRPIPAAAQDIGSWLGIFQIITIIAVITNAGLICFTMDVLNNYSPYARLWIFIGYQWVLFTAMFASEYFVPDIPGEIEIQLKRQEFIVSKVIEGLPDEDEDLLGSIEADLGNITLTEVDGKSSTCCGFYSKNKTLFRTNGDKKLPDVPTQLYNHAYQGVSNADGV